MGKIKDYLEKIRLVSPEDIEDMLLKVVDESKNQAIDLNTSQLFSGKNANGESLGSYQNPEYAAFKRTLNPAGVVDLKLTGDFYLGFFARTGKFPITFFSNDEKTSELIQNYGTEIFGLNQDSLEAYREEIKPEVQKEYRKILFIQ